MPELVYLYGKTEEVIALTVPCLVTAQSCLYARARDVSEEDLFLVGQWDTGATKTAISKSTIKALGVNPTGRKIKVRGVNGVYESDTYLIDLYLPDGFVFKDLLVTEMNDESEPPVLIGLDVILQSDFMVGSKDGRVLLKFRYPSEGDKPFTAEPIPLFQEEN